MQAARVRCDECSVVCMYALERVWERFEIWGLQGKLLAATSLPSPSLISW